MANTVALPPPPIQTPLTQAGGFMSPAWTQWFQLLYQRVGLGSAVSNPTISNANTTITLANSFVKNSGGNVYTSPSGFSSVITALTAQNLSVVAQTVSIYLVPINGTPSSSNILVSSRTVQPGITLNIPELQNISVNGGSSIYAVASSDGSLIVNITGRQVS